MKLICLLLIGLLNFATAQEPPTQQGQTGKITITFTNIEVGKGLLRSAIYGPGKFLSNSSIVMDDKEPTTSSTLVVEYDNVPYGTYAIAAYQDKDENAELSKNWIGMPAEAYGFTKPVKSKFSVPSFNDMSFELNQPEMNFEIKIDYWINQ